MVYHSQFSNKINNLKEIIMAYLCIVISTSADSIAQLNATAETVNTVSQEITLLTNYLDAINAGVKASSIQVTTRDTDPSISTSGSGSTQTTYSHL